MGSQESSAPSNVYLLIKGLEGPPECEGTPPHNLSTKFYFCSAGDLGCSKTETENDF